MKKVQFQVLFLVLILITPLIITSFNQLDDNDVKSELYEKSSEEEQNEEKEAEEEKESETSSEFILYNSFSSHLFSKKDIYYVSKKETVTTVNTDVWTPPPELI